MSVENVYAPQSGTIYYFPYANLSSYGNMAIIDHGGNIYSLLGHMNKFSNILRNGDRVEKNIFIGTIGNTSIYKMSKHLHWGIFTGITQGVYNLKKDAKSIFHGPNYFVNKKQAIDPELMIISGWSFPCQGKITSKFGERNPPPYNNEKFRYHYGIDFSAITSRQGESNVTNK